MDPLEGDGLVAELEGAVVGVVGWHVTTVRRGMGPASTPIG
jgi:hypothetical protein